VSLLSSVTSAPSAKKANVVGRRTLLVPAMIALLALALVTPGGAVVMLAGLLPSCVVLVLDASNGRSLSYAVVGMNLAGAIPHLPAMIALGRRGGHGPLLGLDPWVLFSMYAAAGFGWVLFVLLAALCESAVIVAEQRRRSHLRDALGRLLKEWGPEVAAPPPEK